MPEMSRKELDRCLCGVAMGDRVCLRELYVSLKQPIYLFSLTLLRRRSDAEDIAQQTFLEIMSCAANYKPNSNPRAWIFTITRNLCMDFLKRNSRDIPTDADYFKTFCGDRFIPDEKVLVYEALDRLNHLEKQIVVLFIFAGFKQTEIARVLDISYIAVRSKYGYAIRKLKTFYQESPGG